jgi:TP901 family phage tail tape measure protein
MAGTIPLAHTELADIAAVAGQLGIQGKDSILEFTKTAAEMATAFDMPAEKAATVAAKLTNIYGLGIEKASNLASAINVLGNTTAASESQISDYAMSLGASAVNMGFSSTEAVAMGASLISMGMDASDAGTRLNSAFTKMGKNVGGLADFLEITGDEFRTSFGEDPMAMLISITEKLGEIEDPLERARMSASLFGMVGGKAITGLGGNLEGLKTNLDNAAKGFEENTSLQEEFAAKTDTLKAKFQLLQNALNGAAIMIGTALAPYVEKLALWITNMVPVVMKLAGELKAKLTPAFTKLRDFLKDIIPRVKDLVKHFVQKLQPAFKSVKKITESLGKIFGSFTSDLGDNEAAFATLTSIVSIAADVLNWLAGVIEAVVNWFAEHPTITKFAIAIAAAVALITSPVLLLIAAVAVLAVAWDKDWLGIKTTTLKITAAISKVIKDFLKVVTKFWDKWGDDIIKTVKFAWDAIKLYIDLVMGAIKTIIKVAMALIKGDWEGAWDAIKDYVVKVCDSITKFWDKWGKDIKKFFSDLWNTIKTGVTAWAGAVLATITGWVTDVIGAIAGWVSDTVSAFAGWAVKTAAAFYNWHNDVSNIFYDWISDTIAAFAGWIADTVQAFAEWVSSVISAFTEWASDVLSTITGWASDTISAFTDWASDVLSTIIGWGCDTITAIARWAFYVLGVITGWAFDTVSSFIGWASDVLGIITGWASDVLGVFIGWASDVLGVIDVWASDTVRSFTGWASDVLGIITGWASDTISAFTGWASDVLGIIDVWSTDTKAKFTEWADSIIGEEGILTCWFNDVLALFDGLMNIEFSWPEIPNPFAGIDFCAYIPTWFAKFMGICGENAPPPFEETTPPFEETTPPFEETTPPVEFPQLKAHYDADKSGWFEKPEWSRICQDYVNKSITDEQYDWLRQFKKLDKGGFIPATTPAMVHEGEFVVPKAGALILNSDTNNSTSPITIITNYDIGNVYGVDDLQRVLDAYNKKLVKKLEALV